MSLERLLLGFGMISECVLDELRWQPNPRCWMGRQAMRRVRRPSAVNDMTGPSQLSYPKCLFPEVAGCSCGWEGNRLSL